ncbi:MAG TPA: Clp protease N-terminal domain-containing protein [Cellulomonas sp.]|uniref:Clp protease N-terminal domain-containing protein n=1 Tax=Cellulomonas sp. TaxID=40001 RepID=UPI002E2F2AF6|nr:Clp protease N-terminal domain-containing protein [Cellulomonas sp.]HEX5333228.1 Clp protease N-terminal domain-containing protein [Cellulomonas sp.]
MFERFTEEARAVVSGAVAEAGALGHDPVGAQHLLLGLLGPGAGAGYEVLREAGLQADAAREIVRRRAPGGGALTRDDAEALRTVGIDLDVVLARLAESFGTDAVPEGRPRRGRTRLSPSAKKALQLALREAIWLKSRSIGSEHLLLGLLRCDDGDVNAVLTSLGHTPDSLRGATLRSIGRAA